MLLRPLPHRLEIPTHVLRVEIDISARGWRVPPHLTQHANVDGAHELLSQDVETMGCILVSLATSCCDMVRTGSNKRGSVGCDLGF